MIKINEIVPRDPSSKQKDLDHDLVAEVIDGKKTQMEIQSQVNAMLAMQGINEGAPTRIFTNSPFDQKNPCSSSSNPG
ncbi:hypothetical protein IFM89_037887 [Coptis chinensis]|uniref:Uncharacterized protein n=1 Tax=Coptis chinensis TaxID=261450 RepID=A0A835HZE5_9MAGN|nr:hypothetical protein IFM89_037887 [Coptis chinensis]